MWYGILINFDEVNRGSKSISVRTTVADYSLLKINQDVALGTLILKTHHDNLISTDFKSA